MKMKFRMVSIMCAVCILLSSVAFAAESEPLSANAGGTATCKIVIAGADGSQETRTIAVPIPADATHEEERAIVRAAALGGTSTQAARRAGPFAELSVVEDLPYILDYWETCVGGGTLPYDCNTLTVEFDNLLPGNSARVLYVRLANLTCGLDWETSVVMSPIHDWVYFICSRIDTLRMNEGDELEAYAHTDTGFAEADSCTINISREDMG